MNSNEFVPLIRNAAQHERPEALRQAVKHWREHGTPDGFEQLLVDMLSYNIDGFTRAEIRLVGSLLDDDAALSFLRTLPARCTGAASIISHRDPEPFLEFISDLRDGVLPNVGLWPGEDSPLVAALELASSPMAIVQGEFLRSDWMFLFIGAAREPSRFIPARTLTKHRHDPNVRFANFALSNPRLSTADTQTLLTLLHPHTVAACRDAIPSEVFDAWLAHRLEHGSATDVLDLLASPLALTVLEAPRALRLAALSSLPSIKASAEQRLAQLVPPQDVPLAMALLVAGDVEIHDLAAIVAACRRKSQAEAHSRA
jgi:hypothetical protein